MCILAVPSATSSAKALHPKDAASFLLHPLVLLLTFIWGGSTGSASAYRILAASRSALKWPNYFKK